MTTASSRHGYVSLELAECTASMPLAHSPICSIRYVVVVSTCVGYCRLQSGCVSVNLPCFRSFSCMQNFYIRQTAVVRGVFIESFIPAVRKYTYIYVFSYTVEDDLLTERLPVL